MSKLMFLIIVLLKKCPPEWMNRKTPGHNSLSKFFIRTIHVIKYLHAENGNPDSGVTDVVVMSKSGFCLVIKGRCHPGVVCCLLGEQMASLQEPWRRRRGGRRARVTLESDSICWMCMFIWATKTATEKTDLKEVPNNCQRVCVPIRFGHKTPGKTVHFLRGH